MDQGTHCNYKHKSWTIYHYIFLMCKIRRDIYRFSFSLYITFSYYMSSYDLKFELLSSSNYSGQTYSRNGLHICHISLKGRFKACTVFIMLIHFEIYGEGASCLSNWVCIVNLAWVAVAHKHYPWSSFNNWCSKKVCSTRTVKHTWWEKGGKRKYFLFALYTLVLGLGFFI